jgi:hypothetical protein
MKTVIIFCSIMKQLFMPDIIVLATGNTIPRQLDISNHSFLNSKNYFSNPWSKDCVSAVKDLKKYIDCW